jgi:hypothetical protein
VGGGKGWGNQCLFIQDFRGTYVGIIIIIILIIIIIIIVIVLIIIIIIIIIVINNATFTLLDSPQSKPRYVHFARFPSEQTPLRLLSLLACPWPAPGLLLACSGTFKESYHLVWPEVGAGREDRNHQHRGKPRYLYFARFPSGLRTQNQTTGYYHFYCCYYYHHYYYHHYYYYYYYYYYYHCYYYYYCSI